MSHSSRSRAGFTLIELMVVVAIMAILAAILFPTFSSARRKARQTQCLSNQKQIATAIIIYAHDRDIFPGREWEGEIQIPGGKNLLKCPDVDEDLRISGIGMNTYLHSLRQDTVQRPQQVVLTCDSVTASTISGDHQRHNGFSIYTRCDGSAVCVKKAEQGGRFAAGRFPLTPTIMAGTEPVIVPPDSFTDYPANTSIAKEFVVCGPYGSRDETLAITDAADLLMQDYVGETDLAKLSADDIPFPGEVAPRVEEIMLHSTDTTGNLLKNWQFGEIGSWTPTAGPAQQCVKMELAGNYGTQFYKRTTYAMVFIYSEETRNAQISFLIDDVGAVWLNGQQIHRDPAAADLTGEIATNKVTKVLPKGISYVLFRCTNWTAGGAKFNISFDQPVRAGGTL
ncbi:MAG: type II secretion system protein [Armatimonadota bacterium]